MKIKGIVDEDYSNYQKCSMFIIFPTCTLKCDKENGNDYCQNSSLLAEPDIEISYSEICERYINNPLSHALVLGGLEPFDSFDDLLNLLITFKHEYRCTDDIVIYTGYIKQELADKLNRLKLNDCFPLIIKFGRYRPNQEEHLDPILGINLSNDEQYGEILNG